MLQVFINGKTHGQKKILSSRYTRSSCCETKIEIDIADTDKIKTLGGFSYYVSTKHLHAVKTL